jgi:hypothetical protein
MRRIGIAIIGVLLFGIFSTAGNANAQELPSFLKPYYTPLFTFGGMPLQLSDRSEKNNITHYSYSSSDQRVNLTVENYPCQSDLCRTVFANAVKYANGQANSGNGQFRAATDSEYRVEWQTAVGRSYIFVFRLPTSVQFWTYTSPSSGELSLDDVFNQLQTLVNRQRYEEAIVTGNIEMGRWDARLREFARQLLKNGNTADALIVLRDVIANAPFDFEAQMDFANNTPDKNLARNSATAVMNNAESPELLANAAKVLGVPDRNFLHCRWSARMITDFALS